MRTDCVLDVVYEPADAGSVGSEIKRSIAGGRARIDARAARLFALGGDIPETYWRYARRWMVWGVIATLLPLANVYVMVFKP